MLKYGLAVAVLGFMVSCNGKGDGNNGGGTVPKHKVIAKGTAYSEKDYKIPGKVVILDFSAPG